MTQIEYLPIWFSIRARFFNQSSSVAIECLLQVMDSNLSDIHFSYVFYSDKALNLSLVSSCLVVDLS
jgi:hypothetical protein